MENTKTCFKCKKTKPLAYFYRDKSTKDGHTRRCMTCVTEERISRREYNLNYARYKRENNREEVNTYNRIRHRNLDPKKRLLQQARNRAKRWQIDFDIAIEDIFVPEVCPLLGIEFRAGTKYNYQHSWSLDRLDNNKGYTKNNIWVISSLANTMKSSASPTQLLTFCKNVLSNDDIVRTAAKSAEVGDKEPLR